MPTQFTNTAADPTITFALPSGPITMYFPGNIPEGSPPVTGLPVGPEYVTISAIPPKSQWAALPHWHETHSEHFRVVQGYSLIRLRNKYSIIGPEDPLVNIPPYTIHGFSRADVPGPIADKAWAEYEDRTGNKEVRKGDWTEHDILMHEYTSPVNGRKELFFRNSMSYFRDHLEPLLSKKGVSLALSVPRLLSHLPLLLFHLAHMDNYMLVLDNSLGVTSEGNVSNMSFALSHGLNGFITSVGKLFGWRAWWEPYTPEKLWSVAEAL